MLVVITNSQPRTQSCILPYGISVITGTSCNYPITADREVDRAYFTGWARVLGADWKRAKPQNHC